MICNFKSSHIVKSIIHVYVVSFPYIALMSTTSMHLLPHFRYVIRPRMMVDVTSICMKTTVLGEEISFPVGIAPTAMQKMAHADGEVANAKGTGAANLLTVSSSKSSFDLYILYLELLPHTPIYSRSERVQLHVQDIGTTS